MTHNPGLFLFDIDGTLIGPGVSVHRDAFIHAYRTVYDVPLDLNGIPAGGRTDTWLLAEPLRRQGLRDEQIWARMRQAFDLMEEYVENHLGDLRDRVLPGVPELLQRLHEEGQILGLVTGNLMRIAMAKMRQAGLASYFDTGGFGEESEVRAHLVPVAMTKAGELTGQTIPPHGTVVIGDTPLDVEAGAVCGTRTAAVATGHFTCDDLRATGADLVLPSLADTEVVLGKLLDLVRVTR